VSDFPIPVLAPVVEASVGPVREIDTLPTRADGPQVWRVSGRRGRVFLKRHPSGRGYAQERTALSGWAAALAPSAPHVLAFDDRTRALVLTALPGRRASETVEEDELVAVHRAAGAWLARLHALDVGERDAMGLDEAVARRIDAALAEAPGPLPVERAYVERARARAGTFSGVVRVPCHRDFSPDNWLWDGRTLGVVDFEHARPDCWLVDLAKLAGGPWSGRPALERAFLEGYGRRLGDEDRERLEVFVLLHGLVTWSWGERHADVPLAAHGREILRVLGG
jgi:Ser/Thr protein kinase RdoA (MazF antagonist)